MNERGCEGFVVIDVVEWTVSRNTVRDPVHTKDPVPVRLLVGINEYGVMESRSVMDMDPRSVTDGVYGPLIYGYFKDGIDLV